MFEPSRDKFNRLIPLEDSEDQAIPEPPRRSYGSDVSLTPLRLLTLAPVLFTLAKRKQHESRILIGKKREGEAVHREHLSKVAKTTTPNDIDHSHDPINFLSGSSQNGANTDPVSMPSFANFGPSILDNNEDHPF